MRPFKIITKNKNVFGRMPSLKFTDEILFETTDQRSIKKIMSRINKKDNILELSKIGDKLLLSKKKNFNFNMFLRK